MKIEKIKRVLVQSLGILTTVLSFIIIYLMLFKDGHLQELTTSVIIEFLILALIAISTRFFWYTSTESSVRSSPAYLDTRKKVTDALDEEIDDAQDFDNFIDIENDNNYNRYISNRCKNMTIKNYKLSLADRIHKLFHKGKDTRFYMIRYMLRVERAANKLHKLSGASIRSLTQSADGLIDDRNHASTKKMAYLITSTVGSLILMFITAAISFTNKEDIDMQRVILKMCLYTAQILFSILQSVLTAKMTVNDEDIAYFNKIIAILERYASHKKNPIIPEKVSYIPEEVENGIDDNTSKEEKPIDIVDGLSRPDGIQHYANATGDQCRNWPA